MVVENCFNAYCLAWYQYLLLALWCRFGTWCKWRCFTLVAGACGVSTQKVQANVIKKEIFETHKKFNLKAALGDLLKKIWENKIKSPNYFAQGVVLEIKNRCIFFKRFCFLTFSNSFPLVLKSMLQFAKFYL